MLLSQLHRRPFEWWYLINRTSSIYPSMRNAAQAYTNTGVLGNHAQHRSLHTVPQKHTTTGSGTLVSCNFLTKVATKTERNLGNLETLPGARGSPFPTKLS